MKNKLVFLTLLLTVLALPVAFAATTDTSIVLTNAAPTVGTVTATDPVTLSSTGTVTVWCNATITDTNGYADISSASALLWGPTGTEGGADNFNNHYTNAACTLSAGSGDDKDASCSFSVKYSAESGEWTCKITATDGSAETGSAQATDVTVGVLTGLSTSATMAFDSTALGAVATEKSVTITNKGNSQIDVQLYTYGVSDNDGYSFSCTSGTIAYGALKYNLTTGQDYTANMSAVGRVSSSPVTDTAFDLAKDSNATASTKAIYWSILVPSTGVGGTCAGKLGILATPG